MAPPSLTGAVTAVNKARPSQTPDEVTGMQSPVAADKKLFTSGPLITSRTTKEAMLRDISSRDSEFMTIIKNIRRQLLDIAGVSGDEYTCIPLQGSGTYSVEAVLGTTVPKDGGKVLILENGAYGQLQAAICKALGIPFHLESFGVDVPADPERVKHILAEDSSFTHVSIVHCETSTGLINPIRRIGKIVKAANPDLLYFVDAMSSFGAVPVDMEEANIDFLVSSANKNLEGVPGWAYTIAKTEKLLAAKGNARSLCLDLVAQYEGLEMTGQFRFTPPCHCLQAFQNALEEFKKEGGTEGRAKRYRENNQLLRLGMGTMGFQELLKPEDAGYIVTTFRYPKSSKFNFEVFCNKLSDKGQNIFPGKQIPGCFRLGNIGQLYPRDIQGLLVSIQQVCQDMGISLPLD